MLSPILKTSLVGMAAFALLYPSTAKAQRNLNAKITISSDFPGGNIIVQRISQDTVYLHQDLRDTEGNWFYWSFKIKGAANRKLHFKFVHPWQEIPMMPVIAAKGPAISHDQGKSWKWLNQPSNYTDKSFDYTFTKAENEVYFSMGMNYTETHLQSFLKKYAQHPQLEVSTLALTKQGRSIERLHVGNLRSKPKFRMLLTARHHACEMMASYVLEGMLEELLGASTEANWLRENVEFLVIPFVDKDDVENGDQGKNRRGRDHNRDYSGESIYESTRALRAFTPVWAGDVPLLGLDIHCPFISGGATNESIYLVGGRDVMLANAENQLAELVEKRNNNTTGLQYSTKNNIPFGTSWNKGTNYQKGHSFKDWVATLPTAQLASTFEIPYAVASEREVNQESARSFGKQIAGGLYDYLVRLK